MLQICCSLTMYEKYLFKTKNIPRLIQDQRNIFLERHVKCNKTSKRNLTTIQKDNNKKIVRCQRYECKPYTVKFLIFKDLFVYFRIFHVKLGGGVGGAKDLQKQIEYSGILRTFKIQFQGITEKLYAFITPKMFNCFLVDISFIFNLN